ncbi:transmembrane protein fuseless isoform X2 [Rhodnius prolixus]|uniref:transmembrane protein fuseless isoform X2 n=1 Tax=Rhodnius prolixus TaxID=13249 RepID=UPI003D18ED17
MVYLAILDLFISSTIIAPLVVVFWISIWEFMHRSPEIFPPWWTLYVCISVLLTTGLIRRQVYNIYQKCGRFCSLILSRFFIYINMVFGVGFWKSLWTIMERNFNLTAAMVALAVGIVVLCTIGGATNLLGPPYCISVDSEPSQTLIFTSAFNIKSSDKTWLYLFDCIFSVCVIGTLVVFVWRGTWTLVDLLLWPNNAVMSACASAMIGYTLVVLTFCMQPFVKYLARTLSGVVRLIVVDIYLLFSFCGTVNVWRGIWNLLNHYFLPDMANTSFLLTHLVSFLILMLINSSNSILVRGVYLDCEEQGDQCVDFPTYYVRLFFQTRREKKLLRECEKKEGAFIRKGGGLESVAILPQDGKKPIIIVPASRNNNEVTQPML